MTTAAFIREKATEEHRAIARELATALALRTAESMLALSKALQEKLSPGEAEFVAWAALKAVDRQGLPNVLQALPQDAGPPETPFDLKDIMFDAAFWAGLASPEERKAYAMAAMAHMTEEERHALVRGLEGKCAA